jgi:hypothetical protein
MGFEADRLAVEVLDALSFTEIASYHLKIMAFHSQSQSHHNGPCFPHRQEAGESSMREDIPKWFEGRQRREEDLDERKVRILSPPTINATEELIPVHSPSNTTKIVFNSSSVEVLCECFRR